MAIEMHASATGQHVGRVAAIATFRGRRLGFDPRPRSALAGRCSHARRAKDRHAGWDSPQARVPDRGGAPSGTTTCLVGDEIPLEGRIAAVTDALDALDCRRFRRHLTAAALSESARGGGAPFQ